MPIHAQRLNMHGRLIEDEVLKLGFIGCGSHSFRNVFPCFQHLPVQLRACCDLDIDKAKAFAKQFGADNTYTDLEVMLAAEDLDAVCIVTGYDERGRPLYPVLAKKCLEAGVHVWIEKPPAATSTELKELKRIAEEKNLQMAVGFKKMYMPANQKARALQLEHLQTRQILMQYPQHVPDAEECARYLDGERNSVVGFLDHLCHPMSALFLFMGEPRSVHLERNEFGSGSLICHGQKGELAHIALCPGVGANKGMEETRIIGDAGSILVENNLRVNFLRNPALGYGNNPDFYQGDETNSSIFWEPEFSLGQMYNKGIALLGYFHELEAFCSAVLNNKPVPHGHLDDAIGITSVFETLVHELAGQLAPA